MKIEKEEEGDLMVTKYSNIRKVLGYTGLPRQSKKLNEKIHKKDGSNKLSGQKIETLTNKTNQTE